MFEDEVVPATVEEMADAIEAYVRRTDWVTFVELLRHIPSAKGNLSLHLSGNLVLWDGVSDLFADAMALLKDQRRIFPWPTTYLTYLIDGGMLNLPIVKRTPPPGGFKKPHWLVTCFRVVDSSDEKPKRKAHRV